MMTMLEIMARADAEFCNRDFNGLSNADKRRYTERAAFMLRALRQPATALKNEALLTNREHQVWQDMITSILGGIEVPEER